VGLFERLLARHERERHWRALAALPSPHTNWPWPDSNDEGFLSPKDAAAAMGVSELDLARNVRRGLLEYRLSGDSVLVRPAVVSVLAVRDAD
jgi:hypothetical protein